MFQSVSGTFCLPTFDRWPQLFLIQKASPDNSMFPVSQERGLLLVVGVHSDLIITRESVHEAKELVASSSVHYEFALGQGKAIFRASPVNIGKVNAESPFAIFLLNENHISQPVEIIYFSDSSDLEEFADLFVDRLLPLWGETSFFQLDGFEGENDIQLVGDN